MSSTPLSSGTISDRSDESMVFVNGEPERVGAGCTVERLLAHLELAGERIAVAVDRDVVPRSAWGEFTLAPGARVEILEAVGGG